MYGELIKHFPKATSKMEVLYPAVPLQTKVKKKKSKITLIFSGRFFYHKGGLHALKAIDYLTRHYKNVYGIINSPIPQEHLKKYKENKAGYKLASARLTLSIVSARSGG